ncbi:MAG: U32 family peptidase [Lachnospiraceae bacterium]|nr:U32 family peptidase [Lachnospiraceae bacterium]
MYDRPGHKTPDTANFIKITAGLGSIDDYPDFVRAGVDEVFIGYVPESWHLKYPLTGPMNRREVKNYNVQIGSLSEIRILRKMMEAYQVPVTIALNALSYMPEQYEDLAQYVKMCVSEGFTSFIVADPALLVYLKNQELSEKIKIHISGELGEINEEVISLVKELGADRIIFHRKVDLEGMKECIKSCPSLEYEAFMLNEMCHFHGGFCNSLHCDEMCHMCLVPYTMEQDVEKREYKDFDGVGASGCSLCALWDMMQMGVTHLKLVSRGNYGEDTIRDIIALKKAIGIARETSSREKYIQKMKRRLFQEGCSDNCYYRLI